MGMVRFQIIDFVPRGAMGIKFLFPISTPRLPPRSPQILLLMLCRRLQVWHRAGQEESGVGWV